MKYKCVGSPECLKTFEYGHALRAHVASCQRAQSILQKQARTAKIEHDVAVDYFGIYGLHRNPYYPTSHHIDQTMKFVFAPTDKQTTVGASQEDGPSKSSGVSSSSLNQHRRVLKHVNSNVMSSTQVGQIMVHKE
jgi:hypothetical protein